MSATFETETESQLTTKSVESGEEAKMEPTVSEQPQTAQPTSAPGPQQVTAEQQVPEPGISSFLAAASPEGSPVDVAPLPELSDTVDGTNLDMDNIGFLEGNSDHLLKEFSNIKAVVAEKSFEEKFNALSEKIDAFDPAALFDDSPKDFPKDQTMETEGSSLFSKDINDETLINDLINDVETERLPKNDHKEIVQCDFGNVEIGNHDSFNQSVAEVSEQDIIESNSDDNKLEQGAHAVEMLDVDNQAENEVSKSTASGIDNGLEEVTNGTMTLSTESEDFNEDQNQDDEPKTGTEQTGKKTEPDNSGDKKSEAAKSETSSPTKVVKTKRKEDKSIEHILKALSSLQTTEEKLAALCKKYADLHEEHRVLQTSFKQTQRKLTVVSREKDQLQTEHTKAVMAKSKLESLCRELQKHNQTIRQESIQRAKEEDEKRKEISQKFQTTISEIQQQMQENHDRNKQLREENYELANKLKKFIEQYEAREKQVEKVIQHRELEQKLADAKLEQASAVLMEEKGKNQKEKELLILQSTEFMKKLQIKDAELQMYKERYEEFQSTISKSEEMFQKFKTEMEKMNKRTKKLEKDGAQWKVKWENANRALLEMADEKTKYDKEKSVLLNKISKLESLCRAMQAERQARKMIDTDSVDAATLEKVSSLIPPEVRQAPMGGEETIAPPPSGETPDVEPQPSDPSPGCAELDNNNPDDSLDSGDTELTDTTVIPKEPTSCTGDCESNDKDSGHLENQELSENQSEPNQQPEVNQSTNQDGGNQTKKDENLSDNQSPS